MIFACVFFIFNDRLAESFIICKSVARDLKYGLWQAGNRGNTAFTITTFLPRKIRSPLLKYKSACPFVCHNTAFLISYGLLQSLVFWNMHEIPKVQCLEAKFSPGLNICYEKKIRNFHPMDLINTYQGNPSVCAT